MPAQYDRSPDCARPIAAIIKFSPDNRPDTQPAAPHPAEGSGVLLLQIDGLSLREFNRARAEGALPNLDRRIHQGRFDLRKFYSGQPSNTPAVQAELFFGSPGATPAFSFFDREQGKPVRMYEAEWARRIAAENAGTGDGLLAGGASYANIYTGGADRAKFCGENNTVAHWLSQLSILRLLRLIARHPLRAIRIVLLLAGELVLALGDALGRIVRTGELLPELKFVPARILVAIALREAIHAEVAADIRDGLPVIHANFFGYDEAAHRRGPRSRFAHWSLRGIDRTIESLIRRAEARTGGSHDVIVFSDHGQEDTHPFDEQSGRSLAELTESLIGSDEPFVVAPDGLLGDTLAEGVARDDRIRIHAMGPVAHVYLGEETEPDAERKRSWARRYATAGPVPFALHVDETGKVRCHAGSTAGDLDLLRAQLREAGHPFVEEVLADLQAVVTSRYAGDIVLLGWRHNGPPLSFAHEWGAHAGPGPEECTGFILLPGRLSWEAGWLRPIHLRELIRGIRSEPAIAGSRSGAAEPTRAPPIRSDRSLRIATYNLHGGVGVDQRRDPVRLGQVLNSLEADVVCFQEAFALDTGGDADYDLQKICRDLPAAYPHFHFLPLHEAGGIRYGLAVASRIPFEVRRSEAFPARPQERRRREPRGALWIDLPASESGPALSIINTHFGLTMNERTHQADMLLGDRWLGSVDSGKPTILCGDFNAGPGSPIYRRIVQLFRDAPHDQAPGRPRATFLSWAPLRRIDHIFTAGPLDVRRCEVARVPGARRTSDHLPLFIDIATG